MTQFIWFNGEFKDAATPVFTAHDRLRLGEAVFCTILAIDGIPHFANAHFERLLENAARIWPHHKHHTAPQFAQITKELLNKNNATSGHYAINCTITGGENTSRTLAITENVTPSVAIRIAPFSFDAATHSTHASISATIRRNEHSPLANIKHAAYLDHALALREVATHGSNEAILLNTQGHVCCTTIASIAIIKDGKFITPPLNDGCINGLSRTRLIEQHGATKRSIHPEELFENEGVYILNSLRGAVPIRSINGRETPIPSIPLPNFHHDPHA